MKIRKKSFAILLSIAIFAMGMNVFAADENIPEETNIQRSEVQPRAGCGNWVVSKGTPYCSNELCPGGFKRKLRTDTSTRTCVRADNTIYKETKSNIVLVSCSC